jgi:hypothetical protein
LKSAQTIESSKSAIDTNQIFASLGLHQFQSAPPIHQIANTFQQFQQSAPITVNPILAPLNTVHNTQSPIQNNVQSVLERFNTNNNNSLIDLPKPLLPPTQDIFHSTPFQLNQQNPILNANYSFPKQESAISQTGREDIRQDKQEQKQETKQEIRGTPLFPVFAMPASPAIFRLPEERKQEIKQETSNSDLKASLVASAIVEKNKPNTNLDLLASIMQQTGTK